MPHWLLEGGGCNCALCGIATIIFMLGFLACMIVPWIVGVVGIFHWFF